MSHESVTHNQILVLKPLDGAVNLIILTVGVFLSQLWQLQLHPVIDRYIGFLSSHTHTHTHTHPYIHSHLTQTRIK